MHSFIGYRERMDIHHLNEDKYDNRLCNLVYLSRSEHTSIHFKGKPSWNKGKPSPKKGEKLDLTEEARKRISDAHKGNTITRDRIWVNNGIINKMVYPDQIPEGFVRGVLRK